MKFTLPKSKPKSATQNGITVTDCGYFFRVQYSDESSSFTVGKTPTGFSSVEDLLLYEIRKTWG